MKVRSFYFLASLSLGLAVSFSAVGAKFQPVYSLKNLGQQQDAAGLSFQKVQVKCNTGPQLRYVHRNADAKDWCVNGNSSECFEERMEAATRACSVAKNEITAPTIIADQGVVKSPSPEQLSAQIERDKLQQELIANQQKKIELRTRQLELKKRELKLQTQQDAI
ncbi:MAG: hypothetical protein ACJA2E_001754 [Arenicella sp.]|jgi:hypothetical protein